MIMLKRSAGNTHFTSSSRRIDTVATSQINGHVKYFLHFFESISRTVAMP